jgi:hypothetical protein
MAQARQQTGSESLSDTMISPLAKAKFDVEDKMPLSPITTMTLAEKAVR